MQRSERLRPGWTGQGDTSPPATTVGCVHARTTSSSWHSQGEPISAPKSPSLADPGACGGNGGSFPSTAPQRAAAGWRKEEGAELVAEAGRIRRAVSFLMRFYKLFLRSYSSSGVSVERIPSFFLSSAFKDTFHPPVKIFPDS